MPNKSKTFYLNIIANCPHIAVVVVILNQKPSFGNALHVTHGKVLVQTIQKAKQNPAIIVAGFLI